MGGSSIRRQWFITTLRVLAVFLLIIINSACQPKSPTINLALLGDLMLGRGTNPSPDSLATLMPALRSADLALANLESPLAQVLPAADSTYNLCALSDRAGLLTFWGMDILSLANNHALDCGPNGSFGTKSILETAGISSLGPGMEPLFREVNGVHLAFLGFDDISSVLDVNAATQAIHTARNSGALVVISIHWGAEYQGGISDRQKFLAEQFAQAGAALIWGHHPHVLQPAAWIATPLGKTLVLYSLGNALFDQGGLAVTRQSALVEVRLGGGGIESVRTVPFEIDIADSRVIQPDANTAANILIRLNLP
jgi:poly-gamma-glutamate capsule biosynthesis protein CapA/YwtB (metallophosphatase superfamily)